MTGVEDKTASMFDFNDGNGPVPARQHANGGGWVAETARVEDSAFVSANSRVYGFAQVGEGAWISGNIRIFGEACIFGKLRLHGDARLYGDAPDEECAAATKGEGE